MDAQRALVRVLGRTRQLPTGDALRGVYPPYVPVYRQDGSYIPMYRRDGVAQGVAAYVPAYNADGELLQVVTDGNFAISVAKTAGTLLTVVSAVVGTTTPTAYQFANQAAFPTIGMVDRLYIAVDTSAEFHWGGNVYVQLTESNETTDGLREGLLNLYFTTTRVLSTLLTGLAAGTNAAISAADTVLSALAKIQTQLDNKLPLTGNAFSATTATNATQATKLVTARNINGVPFDGTANITVADATKLPAGSNAVSATKLQTARAINGVPFDGTANISIPSGSPFSVSFVGTAVPPAGGALLSMGHGLGVTPKLVRVSLRCDVTEAGWPVGAELDVSGIQRTDAGPNNYAFMTAADSGTVWVQMGNGPGAAGFINIPVYVAGSGATASPLTTSKWTMVVRAYA